MITWDTDVNAPCCPGQIVNDDGRTVLVQADWDYPGVASTFGWSVRDAQAPLECRALKQATADLDGTEAGEVCGLPALLDLVRGCWGHQQEHPCDHDSTDGTVDCEECGVTPSEFIAAARKWLDEHNGATADDPGYFAERATR